MGNNFQLPQRLLQAIETKANLLKDYCLKSGKSVGYKTAKENLTNWCKNFVGKIPDLEILIPVITNIRFIKDQTIFDRSMEELHKEFRGDRVSQNIWLTPFGKKNESSFRIVSRANKQEGFKDKFEKVIRSISFADDARENVIVFIDDFLNTGGQFERILKFWEDKFSQKNDFYHAWKSIKEECYFRFYFISGMQTGQKRAQNLFKRLGYKRAQATIFQQYDDKKGIFGYPDDQQKIRNSSNLTASDNLIFEHYKYSDIKPFFELCELVAKSFFDQEKNYWSEEKKLNRLLGYGNSAQLFLGQNNVPTPTLTALWANGKFDTPKGKITWEPLFRRIEKKDVGSENGNPNLASENRTSIRNLPEDISKIQINLKIILQPSQTIEFSYFRDIEKDSQINFFSNFHLAFKKLMLKEFLINSDLQISKLIDSEKKLLQMSFDALKKNIQLSNLFKIDYLEKSALWLDISFDSDKNYFQEKLETIFHYLANSFSKISNLISGEKDNFPCPHKILVSTTQEYLKLQPMNVKNIASIIGKYFPFQKKEIVEVETNESFLYLNKNFTLLLDKDKVKTTEQVLKNSLAMVDVMNLLLKLYLRKHNKKCSLIDKLMILSNFIETSEIEKEYFKTIFKQEFL